MVQRKSAKEIDQTGNEIAKHERRSTWASTVGCTLLVAGVLAVLFPALKQHVFNGLSLLGVAGFVGGAVLVYIAREAENKARSLHLSFESELQRFVAQHDDE